MIYSSVKIINVAKILRKKFILFFKIPVYFEKDGMTFIINRYKSNGPIVIQKSIFVDSVEFIIITSIERYGLEFAQTIEFSVNSQIKEEAFKHSKIEQITIPKNIKSIEQKVFYHIHFSKSYLIIVNSFLS